MTSWGSMNFNDLNVFLAEENSEDLNQDPNLEEDSESGSDEEHTGQKAKNSFTLTRAFMISLINRRREGVLGGGG